LTRTAFWWRIKSESPDAGWEEREAEKAFFQGGVRAEMASFVITHEDSGGYQSGLGPDHDRISFRGRQGKTSVRIGLRAKHVLTELRNSLQ
jgi:hypothetical protein